jgi:RPA family protein
MAEFKKREIAYKLRINDLLRANPVFEDIEGGSRKLKFVELGVKKIVRTNIIGNVIDKYQSDGERRFASITLDDGSGQIRVRVFGDDINKFNDITQGDTLIIIGVLRNYNNELYILPELLKKQDPRYLLVRKLELEKEFGATIAALPKPEKQEIKALRDEIVDLIKNSEKYEGIDKEDLIQKINSRPDLISQEIKKLLEEGIIYEPRPGIVRYLG